MKLPFFKKKQKLDTTNFFDLKSKEKKKIINRAVRESTREQVKIMKDSGYAFSVAHLK